MRGYTYLEQENASVCKKALHCQMRKKSNLMVGFSEVHY